MQGPHLRKYGVETKINFELFETDGIDFKVDAVHASGDTKIMKDEGAEANTSNAFVDEGQGYSITLTATEMQAARIVLYIADQGTKVWLDKSISIETYGNASAQHAFDFDTASSAQTGDSYARLGAPAGASVSADIAVIDGNVDDIESNIGTPVSLDSGAATVAGMLTKMADNNGGADFDATTDSLNSLQGVIIEGVPSNEVATAQNVTNGTVDSGSYTDTHVQDGTYFQLSPDGSALDVDLTFDLNTSTPNTVRIHGRYEAAASRYCDVYAWNYESSVWEKISTSTTRMNHTTTDQDYDYILLSRHKESSTGNVKIRFLSDEGTASYNLYLDVIIVKAVVAGASTSEIADAVYLKMKETVYSGAIWIDTVGGTSGTDVGVHGLPSNPVDNLADAITLAAGVGVGKFYLFPSSSITLSQSFTNWMFIGYEFTVALNNQDISGSVFDCAIVSGIATAPSGKPTFMGCDIGTSTLPECNIYGSGITGTLTLGTTSADYILKDCFSEVAGTGTPSLVFASNSNVNFRNYSGGIEIQSMAAGSNMSLEGNGQLVINANCTGGTVAIRGNFTVTDNAGGAITLSDDARYDITQINDQVNDVINVDTKAELSSVPAANASIGDKIALMSMATRNGGDATSSQIAIFKDDGSDLGTGTISDDNTTFTRGKIT